MKAAVFASGGGTNFQALLDHAVTDPPWCVGLLLTDRPGAGALDRARDGGVPAAVVTTKDRKPAEVGADMLRALDEHGIEMVLLAGYLKLIPGVVVARYSRRMLNVHPALLPAFGGPGMYGMHVHRAVLASGARISGASVHYVDEEYDRGPIIGQWPVPVLPDDTPDDLAARVLSIEHRLYPRVADHVCAALLAGREPGPYVEAGEAFRLESHTFSTKESLS